MAVAEGQTLPGPGKQRLGASLPANQQRGFNIAISFSLERNRNADQAAKGAAIASADERVAAARTTETDVFYRLGFDIATGIFGDPTLGAQGNTAWGPGSQKIRDSLSPAGQRGFNAAAKFHLEQEAPALSIPDNPGSGAKSRMNLRRVPAVEGLHWLDAEKALIQAGFKYKETLLDKPDASVLYGHVRATIPPAGTLATPGQEIELQFPRAASRLGIGALGLSDVERRAGFDLDEGRYEEIDRGADIVLREYKSEPHVDPVDGKTYFWGGGLYIEPSDGAVLASLDLNLPSEGSFYFYLACDDALNSVGPTRQTRTARIFISRGGQFCVLTSKHQIAVVLFRSDDNRDVRGVTDYQFHYAIFPPQVALPSRDSIQLKNSPAREVVIPKKPE